MHGEGPNGGNTQAKCIKRENQLAHPGLFHGGSEHEVHGDDEPDAAEDGLKADQRHFAKENGEGHPAELQQDYLGQCLV